MNLKKYTKKQLGENLKDLMEKYEMLESKNQHLRSEIEKHEKAFEKNVAYLQSMNDENKALKDEIQALNNRINKNRRSQKRRIVRLKNAEETRFATVESLFSLYQTIILEDNWNDRIEWKNDILQEIQHMIQYLSR